jgi:hypothetical protein
MITSQGALIAIVVLVIVGTMISVWVAFCVWAHNPKCKDWRSITVSFDTVSPPEENPEFFFECTASGKHITVIVDNPYDLDEMEIVHAVRYAAEQANFAVGQISIKGKTFGFRRL